MSQLTLVLTRTPKSEFFFNNSGRRDFNEDENLTDAEMRLKYRKPATDDSAPPDFRHLSGRWGTLGVIKGPKISSAQFSDPPRADAPRNPTDTTQYLQFSNRTLKVTTDGQVVESIDEYTTIERYRTDGGSIGYIALHAAPDKAYRIYKESGYDQLIAMRPASNGDYIRIMEDIPDTEYRQYSQHQRDILEKERAILIHEAVNVSWLTGCISPRPLNDKRAFDQTDNNNPSARVMRTLFAALERSPRGQGSLFVLDG